MKAQYIGSHDYIEKDGKLLKTYPKYAHPFSHITLFCIYDEVVDLSDDPCYICGMTYETKRKNFIEAINEKRDLKLGCDIKWEPGEDGLIEILNQFEGIDCIDFWGAEDVIVAIPVIKRLVAVEHHPCSEECKIDEIFKFIHQLYTPSLDLFPRYSTKEDNNNSHFYRFELGIEAIESYYDNKEFARYNHIGNTLLKKSDRLYAVQSRIGNFIGYEVISMYMTIDFIKQPGILDELFEYLREAKVNILYTAIAIAKNTLPKQVIKKMKGKEGEYSVFADERHDVSFPVLITEDGKKYTEYHVQVGPRETKRDVIYTFRKNTFYKEFLIRMLEETNEIIEEYIKESNNKKGMVTV